MATAKLPKCAICGKQAVDKFKPFCSPRCATIDLGRWLGEGYAIPGEAETEEDDLTPTTSPENGN